VDQGVADISFILGKIRFSNDWFGSYQFQVLGFVATAR
jgi:hypothetical protein